MSNVILRPWQREDAQQLAAIANNRNIWNYIRDSFPSPYTVLDAIQWIEKEKGANPVASFAVLYDGQIAGSMGIIRDEDVYRTTAEIGYFIGERFWKKGIATEALGQLVKHIQAHSDIIRIVARVFENNEASMKTLRKNGFYLESIERKAAIKNKVIVDVYVWVKLL